MLGFLKNIIGDSNDKELKKLQHLVAEVNELEAEFQSLSNEQLRSKTDEFKELLRRGEELDNLLPEAFAAVREAAKRTLGQRHFDVQLLGGMVLHQGKIAEMKTGEGKTLVATLPVYLNALAGKGVHVVTVNDYLAKRDVQWMGPIYHLLGISVSSIQHESSFIYDPTVATENPSLRHLQPISRREAYLADVIYGTNNEFGFDYLRDNMTSELSQLVQRELHYAIVDEVDNILIDEARTPLIISGPAEESTQVYANFARIVPRLIRETDYQIDEKDRAVTLTQDGISRVEGMLNIQNLYDPSNYKLTQYLDNALKALVLFKKDKDYVVKDGEVILVDEFTGRLMFGRRYSDGLHQALEAKEGIKVQRESITWATITIQNYFRMYQKLAGMTGTAATEAEEFYKIYKLDVVVIPTHQPMIREDFPDRVHKTETAKFKAVADEIEEWYKKGRPVLVGTLSIEKSEYLSDLLRRRGVPHQVLNAKYHEREAAIVAQAGRPSAITVATNMAGRGTDIVLGGSPNALLTEVAKRQGLDPDTADPDQLEPIRQQADEQWKRDHDLVVSLGGLHIIGTERHEARRIDNQLRGRSGRQGDPGSSRFYVSLEDDLMKRFGGDRIKGFMDWAGIEEDVPIENRLVSKSVESAQTRVEGYNFDIRKHLVEYDDVVNKHREFIYADRRKIHSGADLKGNVQEMVDLELSQLIAAHLQDEHGDKWDLDALLKAVQAIFPLGNGINKTELSRMSRTEAEEKLIAYAHRIYDEHEQAMGPENMRLLERLVLLRTIDTHWVEHLTTIENMRQAIGLEAVGQRDPLVMYKKAGHETFEELKARIQRGVTNLIYHVGIAPSEQQRRQPVAVAARAASPLAAVAARSAQPTRKIGRNDPCYCGSGKKYKRCHGA